jgi:hypothetical protein
MFIHQLHAERVEGAKPQALIMTSTQTHAQSASNFIDMLLYDNLGM